MANISAAKTFTAIVSVVTLGAAISFSAGTARAQDKNLTEDQIVRALAPEKKPLTRGLSTGPQTVVDPEAAAAEGKFVQQIRGRSTRSLSSAEREEIAAIVKDKPKIDLEINFDYNSADISTKSLPSVQALGRALSNNDLKGSTFVPAGHTDAAGGETYNQDLLRAPCRRDQALSRRQIWHQRHRSRHRRIWQEQAQGSGPADVGSEPPRPGRQHGKQGHRVERSQIRPCK